MVAFHYSLLSMWASGMLDVTPTGQPWSAYWVPAGGAADWWDYPALVIFSPQAIFAFPPALTLLMLLVAGILGITVAASINLLWAGRSDPTRGSPEREVETPFPSPPRWVEGFPLVVALVSLGTGCGADFTVAGLDLLGGSATGTRASLATLSLGLGALDVVVMVASLLLLEDALRKSQLDGNSVPDVGLRRRRR